MFIIGFKYKKNYFHDNLKKLFDWYIKQNKINPV